MRSSVSFSARRLAVSLVAALALTAVSVGTVAAARPGAHQQSEAPATPAGPTLVPGSLEFLGNAPSLPALVADHEGFFEKNGVNVHVTQVGFGEQDSLFATGNYPITAQAPWDVAKSIAAGDCLKFLSTTAGIPALSLLEIRTADKDKYKSYKDLQGQKIGIPGFGTATWGAFATILKSVDGIDAMTYFDPIEADSSTLLALLDQGQIEAAMPFTPVSVIAPQTQPDKYTILFDMENYFEQQTGQPLLLVGLTARCDWLDANADKVPGVIAGLDEAAQWINDNGATMFADPYYGPILQASGVADQTGADAWAQKLATHYYFDSSAYTQDWIDTQYQFINDSVCTLIDGAPPAVDQIFYQPTIVQPSGSGSPAPASASPGA